jgi:hypothetical protein
LAQPITSAQRAQIRYYLGWSARFHQTDSRLEQAMNAIDVGDVDTYNLIVSSISATPPGLLASLTDVDSRISAAGGALDRVKAMKVGSIELPGLQEIGVLRSQGRQFAGRLAALLGVEVRHDVFSGSRPKGFASSVGLLPSMGTTNLPRLG